MERTLQRGDQRAPLDPCAIVELRLDVNTTREKLTEKVQEHPASECARLTGRHLGGSCCMIFDRDLARHVVPRAVLSQRPVPHPTKVLSVQLLWHCAVL